MPDLTPEHVVVGQVVIQRILEEDAERIIIVDSSDGQGNPTTLYDAMLMLTVAHANLVTEMVTRNIADSSEDEQ